MRAFSAPASPRWCSKQNLIFLGLALWLLLLGSTIYLFKMFAFGPHNQHKNVRPALPTRVKPQQYGPAKSQQNVSAKPQSNEQIDVMNIKRAETNINLLLHERAKAVTTDDDPNYKRVVDKDQAVLIVGGTDGSGTRKVVQVLEYLGTNMVVDDMGTYDIHAEIVKGWPKIVTPVLDITKSLHYDIYDIPDAVRHSTIESLQILLEETEGKITNKTLPIPKYISAKNIYFGFKAPISMALLPFWVNIIPKIKFIHIIRDGRDIAFSENTGPIRKFFNSTYGPNSKYEKDRNEVKAIRLWNDQNLQVHKFIENFREKNSNGSILFDYFTIRTEDLLAQNHGVRFNTLKRLADFIGSNATDSDICCLATNGNLPLRRKEMRLIGRSGLKAENRLKYGKWKAKLKENKLLQNTFAIAAEALKTFGYEPELVYKNVDSKKCAGVACKKVMPIVVRPSSIHQQGRVTVPNKRRDTKK